MAEKIVTNLKFDSRRAPGAVIVTDSQNPSLYVFLAKIRSGQQKGKHQVVCLGVDEFVPGNPALFAALNALPCALYPALKQAVIDTIAKSLLAA